MNIGSILELLPVFMMLAKDAESTVAAFQGKVPQDQRQPVIDKLVDDVANALKAILHRTIP